MVVTRTWTTPAALAGAVALIDVPVFSMIDASAEPKTTLEAPCSRRPVMTTVFPPAVGPGPDRRQ